MANFITRLVSALGIAGILAVHFISVASHKEVYVICAVSYFIRVVHIVSLFSASALNLLGLMLIVVCFLFIGGMFLGLFLTVLVSGTILFMGERNRMLIGVGCAAYYAMGLLILIGLCLIRANNSLPNFQGVEKIEVSPLYFWQPVLLIAIGGYYHLLLEREK